LQSIPEQLYEVSKVEGATKWEEFWKITVPMLGNTIVLVVVFTAIEFCVSSENPVINQAYEMLLQRQIYGQSSAMLWIYFTVTMGIVGLLFLLFHKTCLKKWQ
jgi:ABC-type sugar transport system permease subunit